MNIAFCVPGQPADAWARAASAAGHDFGAFEAASAIEAFDRIKPDVVVAGATHRALDKALARHPNTRQITVVPGSAALRPAADVPLGFSGGTRRPEFACDAAYVGDLRAAHVDYLLALRAAGLRVLVFGDGPLAYCVGRVAPAEVADVYASARLSLDLDANPGRVLAIWAAGGFPLGVKKFVGTGVNGLEECVADGQPQAFARLAEKWDETALTGIQYKQREVMARVLSQDTYHVRLAELLNA